LNLGMMHSEGKTEWSVGGGPTATNKGIKTAKVSGRGPISGGMVTSKKPEVEEEGPGDIRSFRKVGEIPRVGLDEGGREIAEGIGGRLVQK